MRVSREQFQENRKVLLAAASKLFRERGFEAVTVTDVMKSAGLTHGGFYGYFESKDELIAAAISDVLSRSASLPEDLATCADMYLSPAHRDSVAEGCPIAALASDATRHSIAAKSELTEGLRRQLDELTSLAKEPDGAARRTRAIGQWSAMVGALILARLSASGELSEEILRETSAWIKNRD